MAPCVVILTADAGDVASADGLARSLAVDGFVPVHLRPPEVTARLGRADWRATTAAAVLKGAHTLWVSPQAGPWQLRVADLAASYGVEVIACPPEEMPRRLRRRPSAAPPPAASALAAVS